MLSGCRRRIDGAAKYAGKRFDKPADRRDGCGAGDELYGMSGRMENVCRSLRGIGSLPGI